MSRPSPDHLLAETAQLAYRFHWSLDTILDLEHADRRRFLAEADALAVDLPTVSDAAASDPAFSDPRSEG